MICTPIDIYGFEGISTEKNSQHLLTVVSISYWLEIWHFRNFYHFSSLVILLSLNSPLYVQLGKYLYTKFFCIIAYYVLVFNKELLYWNELGTHIYCIISETPVLHASLFIVSVSGRLHRRHVRVQLYEIRSWSWHADHAGGLGKDIWTKNIYTKVPFWYNDRKMEHWTSVNQTVAPIIPYRTYKQHNNRTLWCIDYQKIDLSNGERCLLLRNPYGASPYFN